MSGYSNSTTSEKKGDNFLFSANGSGWNVGKGKVDNDIINLPFSNGSGWNTGKNRNMFH